MTEIKISYIELYVCTIKLILIHITILDILYTVLCFLLLNYLPISNLTFIFDLCQINILNNKVNNNKYFVIFVVMQNDKNIELSPNFININLIYRFFLNVDSMDMQIENLRGLYFSGYPFR